jgi:hypothetical protein
MNKSYKSDGPLKCQSQDLGQRESDVYEPDCGSDDLVEEQQDYNKHHNDHYCNKELMELLIMDACATNDSFSGEFQSNYEAERELISKYEVFLRFVATQSGLTRWQRVEGAMVDRMEERIQEFTNHKRALDEAWYKGAIFQNEIDSESISITGELFFLFFFFFSNDLVRSLDFTVT